MTSSYSTKDYIIMDNTRIPFRLKNQSEVQKCISDLSKRYPHIISPYEQVPENIPKGMAASVIMSRNNIVGMVDKKGNVLPVTPPIHLSDMGFKTIHEIPLPIVQMIPKHKKRLLKNLYKIEKNGRDDLIKQIKRVTVGHDLLQKQHTTFKTLQQDILKGIALKRTETIVKNNTDGGRVPLKQIMEGKTKLKKATIVRNEKSPDANTKMINELRQAILNRGKAMRPTNSPLSSKPTCEINSVYSDVLGKCVRTQLSAEQFDKVLIHELKL